jgi:hypothetical protein
MDVQQILERLLADKEETKADMRQMMADMKADREERKAWREKIEARTKATLAETEAIRARAKALRDERTEANPEKEEASPQETGEWIEETPVELQIVEVSIDTRTEKLEELSERQEIPMEGAAAASLEQDPKEMESGSERREVPKKEVAGKSSRVTKKRPRGRRTAAGRRVKPTKLIRGDGESRKKLVVACRKVSCRAAVAWRERNLSRKIRIQVNGGSRQRLGAAGIIVTLRAKLARRKGTFAKRDPTRDSVEQGACKEQAFGERHRTDPTGSQGVKNQTRNKAGRRTSRQLVGKKQGQSKDMKKGIRFKLK